METTERIEAKSQYQHFIPRFVLREFAETPTTTAAAAGASGEGTAGTSGATKRTKRRWKKKKKGGGKKMAIGEGDSDDVSSGADSIAKAMKATGLDEGDGRRSAVKKVEGEGLQPRKRIAAGNADTCRPRRTRIWEEDPRNPLIKYFNLETGTIEHNRIARAYGNQDMYRDATASDANHIEKQLSVLEQVSSRVFNRTKDALKLGATTVDLTRTELYTIRKFLFVMKYRSQLFWQKYNRPSVAEYVSVDKPDMVEFMRQRGFKKPAEVWLCTMKAILDTPIDPQGKWEETVLEKGFKHDALWFILNMTEPYLNFCAPQDPEEDEFIITDNGFGIHEGPTGASPPTGSTTGDKQPRIVQYTEYHKMAPLAPNLLVVLRSNYLRPGQEPVLHALREASVMPDIPSVFEDLRLEAAMPSYVNVGEPVEPRDDHVFTFKIQKLSRKWVHLFNTIALAEANKSITWKSDAAMQRTLWAYLEHPDFQPVLGLAMGEEMEPKAKLFNLLSSDATTIPEVFTMTKEVKRELQKNPNLVWYFKLGGTPAQLMHDIRHSSDISRQRSVSADKSPKGPQHVEAHNANSRKNMIAFSKLPSTAIYWHIKKWRLDAILCQQEAAGVELDPERIVELAAGGPEDWVAELAGYIQEEHRSRLMLEASMKMFFREINLESVAKMGLGREISMYIIMDKELELFKQWGGISSSCFLESYPDMHTNIGAAIMDPKRSKETEAEIPEHFINDLKLRRNLRLFEVIENSLCGGDGQKEERTILQKLLWEALYWLPQSRAGDLAEIAIAEGEPGCVLV